MVFINFALYTSLRSEIRKTLHHLRGMIKVWLWRQWGRDESQEANIQSEVGKTRRSGARFATGLDLTDRRANGFKQRVRKESLWSLRHFRKPRLEICELSAYWEFASGGTQS